MWPSEYKRASVMIVKLRWEGLETVENAPPSRGRNYTSMQTAAHLMATRGGGVRRSAGRGTSSASCAQSPARG